MVSVEAEYLTVAEAAMKEASIVASSADRFLFTGRMLVKAAHENTELPASVEANEALQFYAPELRVWAKPLFKLASASYLIIGSVGKSMMDRTLEANRQAKRQPNSYLIYTSQGRHYPTSI